MTKAALVGGLAVMLGIVTPRAEDYPLTFHAIPAKDAATFPGGFGTMGQLRTSRPAKVKREPKAVSRHVLYGESRDSSLGTEWCFRLDESQGDGTGYDQLIVDVDQNGDLTDDVPAARVESPSDRKESGSSGRTMFFGPIQGPAGKLVAGGQPIYYAQVHISNIRPTGSARQAVQSMYVGYVRFKAGWYVDATVELNGRKLKVGVFDGNGNDRLGDVPKPQKYSGSSGASWYFRGGDTWLVDVNGSGKFERDGLNTESCPFGPLLYLGGTPCKAAMTADGKALRVEPWTGPLAEVTLQPRGDQVSRVTLAWEQAEGQWTLIRAGADAGRIKVPAGSYRLYACELVGKAESQDQVMVLGYQSMLKMPFSFTSGGENTLRCGAPLNVKATAGKRRPQSWELARNRREDSPLAADSGFVLAINANIRGADGEVYSQFAKGEKLDKQPPLPTFTVVDAGGRKMGDGKLEFG